MSVKRFAEITETILTHEILEDEDGDYVLYTDYASLLERCEKMEAQLEAVKRLAKAHQNFLDAQDDHHGEPDHPERVKAWEEKENAYYACYILGIDPK